MGQKIPAGGPSASPVDGLPGPAPKLGDKPGTRYYEIPITIQDRSFDSNGSLFYPGDRAFFEGLEPDQLQIDFAPDSDVAPIWNPEAFFNSMVVNGRTWPRLNVEPRRYRFRLLNGCDARFLNLSLWVVDHLHLVQFQVVDREPMGGAPYPPEPWETGFKDTVIAYPGEITRIRARFDVPGLYVWHCHIVEHEDNEMMRPYCVGTPGVDCPADLFGGG